MRPLPFHRPTIGPDDVRAVSECLRSGWLTTGPRAEMFERAFARFSGGRHAVATNSCTAALHLALLALGVGPGDEVVTSPITFASTANVIVHAGARPVFADVEPERLTLDPSDMVASVTRRTAAVVPVHFAGHPCDMGRISADARQLGLKVVADAAHAAEALHGGRKVGSMGDAVCYSFYATKNITTGEGGMAVVRSAAAAERMRVLRTHGMSRDAWRRYVPGQYRHWEILEAGFKYNMSDIQAALGLSQLRKAGRWLSRREALSAMYDEGIAGIPAVRGLRDRAGDRPARHLYVVLVERRGWRDRVIADLQRRGVGVGVHFRAVHLSRYYSQRFGFRRGMLPVAEDASDRLLSLPLYPSMTEGDVARVLSALRKAVGA